MIRSSSLLFVLSLSLFVSLQAAPARADRNAESPAALPNLHQVEPNFWRSGRPQPAGLAQLAAQGLKVVVDLEDDLAAAAAEAKVAESLGIRHVSLPISPGHVVTDETVNQALALLREKDLSPVLVHCYAGQDRTGMIVGLYRVTREGWTPAAAYQEMLSLGFHPSWKELDAYFHQRTGLPFLR